MTYLEGEIARARTEIAAAEAAVTSLTAQAEAQEQAVAAALARVAAARTALAEAQAALQPLEAAAAGADRRVEAANRQIEQHQAEEPERFIERPNKPPLPNPEWRVWQRRAAQLGEQRARAAAEASAAHSRAADGARNIAQARAGLQAAEVEAVRASAALGQLQQALSEAQARVVSTRQEAERLDALTLEIEREPMDRNALERAAADLSRRTLDLEDAWAAARASSRAADEALAALIRRQDQLAAAIGDVKNRLVPVNAEVVAADRAVAGIAQQIDDHIAGGL